VKIGKWKRGNGAEARTESLTLNCHDREMQEGQGIDVEYGKKNIM
jgi:hypothetical protein